MIVPSPPHLYRSWFESWEHSRHEVPIRKNPQVIPAPYFVLEWKHLWLTIPERCQVRYDDFFCTNPVEFFVKSFYFYFRCAAHTKHTVFYGKPLEQYILDRSEVSLTFDATGACAP